MRAVFVAFVLLWSCPAHAKVSDTDVTFWYYSQDLDITTEYWWLWRNERVFRMFWNYIDLTTMSVELTSELQLPVVDRRTCPLRVWLEQPKPTRD